MAASSSTSQDQVASSQNISIPFPIFTLASKYLLYDINTITYTRAIHNISGVLIGSLPQAPQQNVFLGIPLELMPEEARLLVEKGVAYIVDDVKAHKTGYLARDGLEEGERKAFQLALRKQGQSAAKEVNKRSDERKKAALEKVGLADRADNWNDIPNDMFSASSASGRDGKKKKGMRRQPGDVTPKSESETQSKTSGNVTDESLFGPPVPVNGSTIAPLPARKPSNTRAEVAIEPSAFAMTPTTSYPPLKAPLPPASSSAKQDLERLPPVPASYSLYRYLHERGYFLSPGLRFGCQYTAYPGDPLRFHSHFLCNGMDWDEEFDLLDLVGGGRLGTGVKKGYLIGGQEHKAGGEDNEEVGGKNEEVRAFCVEWAGM
ncbi:SEN34 subunit of tRNA-splicing endonuclease [Polychaeton citri CBS 116435]|uniref:tRNA-intron lyase n=1 Tax=Polychaeton citri CBS 116435 TaxID=1314669 RepID=A0A9P4Q411_9PEZI|nr:SEN34 subunit of tRNA-splicing endonuclease [Polychaeton citri CBS 116435]